MTSTEKCRFSAATYIWQLFLDYYAPADMQVCYQAELLDSLLDNTVGEAVLEIPIALLATMILRYAAR
jgi:hypothetical protein